MYPAPWMGGAVVCVLSCLPTPQAAFFSFFLGDSMPAQHASCMPWPWSPSKTSMLGLRSTNYGFIIYTNYGFIITNYAFIITRRCYNTKTPLEAVISQLCTWIIHTILTYLKMLMAVRV